MTAQEIINNIETSFLKSDLIYEMMFAHFMNLSGFGFQTIPLKQGSSVVRARYTDRLASFSYLDEVSYPKSEYVTKFSRLNRPNQSLFYASETENACLTEMLPFWIDDFKKGDIISVTLGKWIVRNDLKLIIIPDTKNINVLNQKMLSQLQAQEIEFWDYISGKFKTSTKQDKRIYEFTSAFGNALWLNTKTQNIKADGFIYSSVQSLENLNIALCTQNIDSGDLIPVEFVETHFQRGDLTDFGLPSYNEIGERKRGLIDLNKVLIDWIE